MTRGEILACGATSLAGVKRATRAATGCGGCSAAIDALLGEPAEVGFQAVQLEPAETIEVIMRGPVEVGGAGGQQAALAGGGVEDDGLLGRVGYVEGLDAVEPRRRERVQRRERFGGRATSQNGCAQTASPPAAWMTSIASGTVGRERAT